MKTRFLIGPAFLVGFLILCCTSLYAENIDPNEDGSQYAYGENVGWLNFEPNVAGPNVGATVSKEKLTGFVWAENVGWVSLSCENTSSCGTANYGVTNDAAGNLAGYAWAENVGWISFSCENTSSCGTVDYGVTIDGDGEFAGYAWAENIGWINFNSAQLFGYGVKACKVNFTDLANFVDDWLDSGFVPGNLDSTGNVDFKDYSIFADYWRDYCPDGWPLHSPEPYGNLLFSEYVEGSSWNKAVEIYNAGNTNVNLADCQVRAYHNGSATPTYTIYLDAVTLAPGDVFVLANPNIDDSNNCDQFSGSITFNGDDAVELVYDGVTQDVIGQIGFDPGSYWGSGQVTTQNHTLRRKCPVTSGDSDGEDVFDPSVEWNGFPQDTFDGLGSHCQ
ncbi:MAG: lamin tail domain-containing protein [Planctomycetota bacterium]|jgi:hypothetical protein